MTGPCAGAVVVAVLTAEGAKPQFVATVDTAREHDHRPPVAWSAVDKASLVDRAERGAESSTVEQATSRASFRDASAQDTRHQPGQGWVEDRSADRTGDVHRRAGRDREGRLGGRAFAPYRATPAGESPPGQRLSCNQAGEADETEKAPLDPPCASRFRPSARCVDPPGCNEEIGAATTNPAVYQLRRLHKAVAVGARQGSRRRGS